MLPDADVVRLRHMLDAAAEAIEFMQGHARQDLDTNRMLSHAVVRDIEIVGEAGASGNTVAEHYWYAQQASSRLL